MKKCIVLCADDYGQAPSISRGILALVKEGRLSAVSCLVTTPYWKEHAAWLKPFHSHIDIGLHFNLTEGQSSLSRILLRAAWRGLDRRQMEVAWHAQIDAFEEAMGFTPHFIDGHQHVHQLRGVREALCDVYEKRLRHHAPYVRVVNGKVASSQGGRFLKMLLIKATGSSALQGLLDRNKIKHNQSFSGIYSFSTASEYARHFASFLDEVGEGGMIMCHPGYPPVSMEDPIGQARYLEYQYLSGLRFRVDCDLRQVAIYQKNRMVELY